MTLTSINIAGVKLAQVLLTPLAWGESNACSQTCELWYFALTVIFANNSVSDCEFGKTVAEAGLSI
jgi:hypothetical protein